MKGESQNKAKPPLDWNSRGYARLYDRDSAVAHFFAARIKIILDLIHGDKKDKILDVGCGPGMMIRHLIDGDSKIIGLDLSPAMIRECLQAPDLSARAGFLCGSAECLPFADGIFDIVLAMGVLEYVTDASEAVRELARVTKKEGIVILTMLNKISPYRLWERWVYYRYPRLFHGGDGGDLSLYSAGSFCRLVESRGLEVLKIVHYDFNLFPPPFDRKMPRRAVRINSKLESILRNYREWLSSGFIVKAKTK
jgi:ubiquinone/menaquinone biosynthesis C-methylase UbiE